jgi:hypothetical protein
MEYNCKNRSVAYGCNRGCTVCNVTRSLEPELDRCIGMQLSCMPCVPDFRLFLRTRHLSVLTCICAHNDIASLTACAVLKKAIYRVGANMSNLTAGDVTFRSSTQNARTNNLKPFSPSSCNIQLHARSISLTPILPCNAAHLFALRPTIRVSGYLP